MIVGVGIGAMHYIGMAALELCRAVYTPLGIGTSIIASCVLSVIAFGIAYGRRNRRNILLGTVVFGVAVCGVHFVAIAGTNFVQMFVPSQVGPMIGNETLAIGVVLSSFALCGAFLLSTTTFLPNESALTAEVEVRKTEDAPAPTPVATRQIPYEQEGRTQFIDASNVAAIRAEGHYTYIYTKSGQFFCAWSIADATKRLVNSNFIKTHRSYLVNPAMVTGFERLKDTGVVYFNLPELPKVPVSRSQLKPVRDVLGV